MIRFVRSAQAIPGGGHFDLFLIAWREWKASAAYRGTSDAHALPDPPLWFVRCELGHGICGCSRCAGDRGASLLKTFERWRRVNRVALKFLDAPVPVSLLAPRRPESFTDTVARVQALLGLR